MKKLLFQIRLLVIIIMCIVLVSGIATCFPLSTLQFLSSHRNLLPAGIGAWMDQLTSGLNLSFTAAPFMAYAFVWLGFSHFIIALLFAGVIAHPVRNEWVISWSIICCLFSIPFIFITGYTSGIPLFHCLFDCSFSVAGLVFLFIIQAKIKKLNNQV
jgi:hypothetical protein